MELNKEHITEDATKQPLPLTTVPDNAPSPPPPASSSNGLVRFWHSITVEPVVVCFVVGLYLMSLADQNMYLEKACLVNRNYSAELCAQLMRRESDGIETEDRLTEATYNGVQIWTRPLTSWLAGILVLFWGAWSDRSGRRKPCIIGPLAAQLIISVTNLLTSSVFVNTPIEVPMYSNAVVDGLSGGAGTLLVGVYSYLTDVTSPDELSYRVGMTNVCLLIGNIFGNAISGLVVRYLGFQVVYSLAATLFVFAMCYTLFVIDESPRQLATTATGDGDQTTVARLEDKRSVLRQFFDLDHIVQTFRVVFRRDALNPQRRPIIILLLVIWVLVAGPVQSEGSLVYLFARLRYNWTEVEMSFFITFGSITALIGNTVIVDVLSNRLKASDAVIAIVGLTSKMLANCVYCSALYVWMLFAGSVVEMLSSGTIIAMRSIASKAVASDEVGKMNALLALVESAVPLIFTPLYVTVYDATRDYWPGAFLALGVVLLMPALPAFVCMGRIFKRTTDPTTTTDGENKSAPPAGLPETTAHDNKSFEPDGGNERIKSITTYL